MYKYFAKLCPLSDLEFCKVKQHCDIISGEPLALGL